MKCNKCGYTSFDHNQNCPKCNYDLVAEATKMNLPSYMASPPYLLASLLGGKDEYISAAPSRSRDYADSPSEKDSEISMLSDIMELPHITILPGLAEAVAELAKNEEEEPGKRKHINVETPRGQEKSNDPSKTFPDLNEAAVHKANVKHESDEEDMFEFILDEEQSETPKPAEDSPEIEMIIFPEKDEEQSSKEPGLKAKSEPVEEPLEIELTMVSEKNEDQQIQPEVTPEKETAQDIVLDDLIELTEVKGTNIEAPKEQQKQEKPKEFPPKSSALKITFNTLNKPVFTNKNTPNTAKATAVSDADSEQRHDKNSSFEFTLDLEESELKAKSEPEEDLRDIKLATILEKDDDK